MRPSVRACVRPHIKKGPKGLQNHQETVRFIDKSGKVKSFQGLKLRRLAKCTNKHWFGTTSRNFFFKIRKNLGGFFATEECKKVDFSTFPEFLSRNASISALKGLITFIVLEKCKK